MTLWGSKEFAKVIIDEFDLLGILPHTMPNAIGMWPNEQLCLVWCALQVDHKENWWEIGSFCGGSTVLLGKAKKLFNEASYTSVVAVDPDFNPMFDLNIRRAKLEGVVSKVDATSLHALSKNSSPISFAFIDGWHSFNAVICEFDAMEPHLTEDAIIAFHDVSPRMHTNDQAFIAGRCEYVKYNWETLLREKEQDFRIDEAVCYICDRYGYEVIDIPVRENIKYFKETGLETWVRGKTSPFNAFTAIRKTK